MPQTLHNKIRLDPAYFYDKWLGFQAWEKQMEMTTALRDHRKIVVRSCHGAGKTAGIARAALWFLYAFPPAVVIDTAPTHRQVEQQFWREMRAAHGRALRPLGGRMLKTSFNIDEDWYAFGFSTKETEGGGAADKFQGFHGKHILVIVDEASGVHKAVFEAIDGAISGGAVVRLIYIGNPTTNEGDFAAAWNDPTFYKIQIGAEDIPNVKENRIVIPGLTTRQWVEDMARKYGTDSDVYRVRVQGLPPLKGSNSFIGLDLIENAIDADRKIVPASPILGVDVARYGDDSTDMVERKGNTAKILDIAFGQSGTETAGKVIKWLLENKRGRAHIDTIGVGGPVFDIVKDDARVGARVFSVNVATAPVEDDAPDGIPAGERFPQLRDQGWDMARDWLKTGILEAGREEWYQLAKPRYKILGNGKTKIESKDDMKKRGVPSPNTADALILTLLPGEQDETPGVWTA